MSTPSNNGTRKSSAQHIEQNCFIEFRMRSKRLWAAARLLVGKIPHQERSVRIRSHSRPPDPRSPRATGHDASGARSMRSCDANFNSYLPEELQLLGNSIANFVPACAEEKNRRQRSQDHRRTNLSTRMQGDWPSIYLSFEHSRLP